MYHGDSNESIDMVKKEEGQEKQQPTGPEPATSSSTANPLAPEPWSLPASITVDSPSKGRLGTIAFVLCMEVP